MVLGVCLTEVALALAEAIVIALIPLAAFIQAEGNVFGVAIWFQMWQVLPLSK